MNKLYFGFAAAMALSIHLQAATYYVATNGSDSNAGTNIAQPFATPQYAVALSALAPGDTIYVRGGVYNFSAAVKPGNKKGTAGNPIKLWAYPGEHPIFNFASMPGTGSSKALDIRLEYWHVKGIEIENAPDTGVFVGGLGNIIEGCAVHDSDSDGMVLGSSSVLCTNALILNCDSYRNILLSTGGQDGDGFDAKEGAATGIVFSGCRAWNNADDGWDFYTDVTNVIVLTNCWAFENGIDLWNLGSGFIGNGNGFKLGGASTHAQHVLENCVAFQNVHKGFDQNYNAGGITLLNCTAYSNILDYSFPQTLVAGTNVFKNNIAYLYSGSGVGTGLTDILTSATIQVSNSWQGFTVSAADFVSLDTSSATNARNADYSLPNVTFLHLAAGSDLIDAGVNVGLPFNGSAPDLGAFEYTNNASSPDNISFNTSPGATGWTNGGFQLTVSGLTGHGPVVIFVSTDFSAWTPIATNPAVVGTSQFFDSSATNGAWRFYRAEEQ